MLKVMHKCKENIVVGGYRKIEFRIAEGGSSPIKIFSDFWFLFFLKPSLIPTYIITQTVNSKLSKVKMTPIRTIRQLIFVKNSAVMIMVSESSVSLRISCIIIL